MENQRKQRIGTKKHINLNSNKQDFLFYDFSRIVFCHFSFFPFAFAGKNLEERQGIARASFWQILVQIRRQETRKLMFSYVFAPERRKTEENKGKPTNVTPKLRRNHVPTSRRSVAVIKISLPSGPKGVRAYVIA